MTIIYIVLAVIVLWAIVSYNGFIRLINRTKEAWSDIDVQLKRRYDLIPNLVEAVKGYATHEKTAFENVTQARANALNAQGPHEKEIAENQLSGALKSIFAVAEAYPELKANQNFLSLQGELSETENTISSARRYYNGNVRELNTSLTVFPGNLIASVFKFSPMEFFQLDVADAAAKNPVQVKF